MIRLLAPALLSVCLLAACSPVAPIYIVPSSPPAPPAAGVEDYSVDIEVLPRIGLFDELLYSCKSDYLARIEGELIQTAGILPGRWDAVIPKLDPSGPAGMPCPDTHVGGLAERQVRIEVRVAGKVPAAGCSWHFNDNALSPPKDPESCSYSGIAGSNEAVPFKVTFDGRTLAGEVPRDFLLVSMGDSYASGEGNPDGVLKYRDFSPDPASVTWMSRRCHRSLWAGAIRAGMEMAKRTTYGKGESVRGAYTILSTACSGAELRDLVTTGYPGRETLAQMRAAFGSSERDKRPFWMNDPRYAPERRLNSQVKQIDAVLQGYHKNGAHPLIDLLVLSAGGNDVNFGGLVVGLITRRNMLDDSRMKDGITRDIGQLADDFNVLAGEFDRWSVDRVFLTGYPDPTKISGKSEGKPAVYCGCGMRDFLGLGAIEQAFFCLTPKEDEDASTQIVDPLNRQLGDIAKRYGWRFLPGIADGLVGHAWCQDADKYETARFVRTLNDSMALQGALPGTPVSTGAMHPSANGHEFLYMAKILEDATGKPRSVTVAFGDKVAVANDGSTIVPPNLTLTWDGEIPNPERVREACRSTVKDDDGDCPLDYPQVWLGQATEKNSVCAEIGRCQLDVAGKSLSIPLPTSLAGSKELLVKVRDAELEAQPMQSLGPIRVDARKPKIESCRFVYPEATFACASLGRTWLRASDARLELSASAGESGIGDWRCDGPLAGRCTGRGPNLSIGNLPGGDTVVSVTAESGVGLLSDVFRLPFPIDDVAPEIRELKIAGIPVPDDTAAILTRATAIGFSYRAEDRDSGVAVAGRCKVSSRHAGTFRVPAGQDGAYEIALSDCAKPGGNRTVRRVEVVRPLVAPSGAPALNTAQWLARLEMEPGERGELLARIARISPRFANLSAVNDADLPVLTAWLNLVSGRIVADGKAARYACATGSVSPGGTAFGLARAVDSCTADKALAADRRELALAAIQAAGLLGENGR